MVFADDIVLVDETRDNFSAMLKVWRQTLELKRVQIKQGQNKIHGVQVQFSDVTHEICLEVRLDIQVIQKEEVSSILGLLSKSIGRLTRTNVTYRIGAGWMKWRLASGVLCNEKLPPKLKGKFYKVVVRPTLLYGMECWPVKKSHIQKMKVAEMIVAMDMSIYQERQDQK